MRFIVHASSQWGRSVGGELAGGRPKVVVGDVLFLVLSLSVRLHWSCCLCSILCFVLRHDFRSIIMGERDVVGGTISRFSPERLRRITGRRRGTRSRNLIDVSVRLAACRGRLPIVLDKSKASRALQRHCASCAYRETG